MRPQIDKFFMKIHEESLIPILKSLILFLPRFSILPLATKACPICVDEYPTTFSCS